MCIRDSLEAALKRVPMLEKAGIRKFFAGPESFTPDTNTLLGEVPGFKNLPKNLPVLRDFDDRLYLKEDAGKLLVGIFEGKSIPAFNKTNRVPEDFSFGEFPENFDHFESYLSAAIKRVPILEKAGIRKFFAGPESFTPDTNTPVSYTHLTLPTSDLV